MIKDKVRQALERIEAVHRTKVHKGIEKLVDHIEQDAFPIEIILYRWYCPCGWRNDQKVLWFPTLYAEAIFGLGDEFRIDIPLEAMFSNPDEEPKRYRCPECGRGARRYRPRRQTHEAFKSLSELYQFLMEQGIEPWPDKE